MCAHAETAACVQPGLIHHITAHGVDTRALFSDDLDRGRFVKVLAALARVHDWHCLAFCLMTTHFHLLVQERDDPLSRKRCTS
jgi:REP element-mobilizing transposase RayT